MAEHRRVNRKWIPFEFEEGGWWKGRISGETKQI